MARRRWHLPVAGGLTVDLAHVPHDMPAGEDLDARLLFSESNTRFVCEVPSAAVAEWKSVIRRRLRRAGEVTDDAQFQIKGRGGDVMVSAEISQLKSAWQSPLWLD